MDLKASIKKLPQSPGVYKFFDKGGKLLYVGKAVLLKKRVSTYFQNKNLGPKTNLLVQRIAKVEVIKVFSEFEALLLEAELIRAYQPFFNVIAKDDKSPLYIKIEGREIPLITTTRKERPKKGVYLKGPFPSAKAARSILKIVRRIFPYCQHKNPKKPCLYVHLGLCPYPYSSKESAAFYRQNIQKIKKLLSGKTKSLTWDLTREMIANSKDQKFEEAARVKKQIEQLKYLTTTYRTPREYLEQPTLVDDLALARLKDLQKVLGLSKVPKRIECYDISNISGKNATGSMAVFIGGQPAKDQYRRFKIKFLQTPNDYQMLQEVITRRLKNDWPKADLMVIDGGKGQLGVAQKIVEKLKVETKVISLAKRLEEIHTSPTGEPLRLPKESSARQLVQALRDEAHRFAITYHRLLRSKQLVPSTI